MVNVLYISPFARVGGGEISLLTIIRNLDRDRFHPHLICFEEGPFLDRARGTGVNVVLLKRDTLFSNLAVIAGMVRYIHKHRISLVHVNSLDLRAVMASRLAGVPCIGHLRVIFPFTRRDRIFVKLARRTIAVSESVIDAFCRTARGCRSRFVVIPNAVEVPAGGVVQASLKKEYGCADDSLLVGAVGRIDPFKGYEYFIRAAVKIKEEIPSAHFFIVGEPGDNAREEAYFNSLKAAVTAAGLGGSFIFTGFRNDPLQVMAAFDVLVVPSVMIQRRGGRAGEGFGRVAVEGMAVGVPVVASHTGGLREIVENGISGIHVAPSDAAGIAGAVIGLLRDPAAADRIRRAARKRYELLYSVPKFIGLLEGVYSGS